MHKTSHGVRYSATDIVAFLECEHCTTLDVKNLHTPMARAEADEEAILIQEKGDAHEAAFLERLREQYGAESVIDITQHGLSAKGREQATLVAMRAGADIIYQGVLSDGPFLGYIDFMRKVEKPSQLGPFSYEPLDTKLARSTRAKFIVQLATYCALLKRAQGIAPEYLHVVLGTNDEMAYRCADYAYYFEALRTRFISRVQSEDVVETYPEPCSRCSSCQWRDGCEKQRLDDDHLSQVANLSKLHVKRLSAGGVTTLEKLATTPELPEAVKIAPPTYQKLHRQAELQHRARTTGERYVEHLPLDPQGLRGFYRMPEPSRHDLYFDMEGDPLVPGGLEYLFGVYLWNDLGEPEFVPFWAHSRAAEKRAFEDFIDFVTAHLENHPDAYIYHYADYERTALQRLMMVHGTREEEVDNLLRQHRLVDLYKVVRESIVVSEPNYSIKSIEHFYFDKRTVEVKNAGASIVYYEEWLKTREQKLLDDIEAYNLDDVKSTAELHKWMLAQRPALDWAHFGDTGAEPTTDATQREADLGPMREALVDGLPADPKDWSAEESVRDLVYQLLSFHRRAAKPEYWDFFRRKEATVPELIDDAECLGALERDYSRSPVVVDRSRRYFYKYPPQDTKLRTDSPCKRTDGFSSVSDLIVDPSTRTVSFKVGITQPAPADELSLVPPGPIGTDVQQGALLRFARSFVEGNATYPALEAFLRHELPEVDGLLRGEPLVPDIETPLPHIIETVMGLKNSVLFVQGPPGTGKTYTGSHIIVELLKAGKRVAISSNSHHAINNLLSGVEKVAKDEDYFVYGAKRSDKGHEFKGEFILDIGSNAGILDGEYDLVAGTSWLFSRPEFDQTFDYLFIDEAGQVALANMIAMGTCAKNVVLLGDQMQLSQPVKGVHPGRSGESSLDYLLSGKATIPPEQGIFLKTTYRMHPDVCGFISDAVYDGRLQSHPSAHLQGLVLSDEAHPALKPTGISYLPVIHDGCSQDSPEEAEVVRELFTDLLKQAFRDKAGVVRRMTAEDILVVAPFNVQVNRLRATLPAGARVGTVDAFQGQEAQAVLVSMTTSNGDYVPRNIEFLFSKNRLNVAISRAKCLAVLVASPALQTIQCSTPEEMSLVNTLCFLTAYAADSGQMVRAA
ncbi:TM0106 family RecB-like putative nuclease [Paraburkholderia sp. UCT31]|uniref:TM0106 family RecB-like putative nuclease n=1 Tax=Paraburkholderia sp. UCT31 TaxID=2615209 RepID=UPI0016561BF2|nr:TM0106 family RecB-like putative nuclease [Paraburkholderia sp. UCT31]MBC8737013.1 TM0106 family RecB-like putative nuclease [Paraburkholderia sp. UCT31]